MTAFSGIRSIVRPALDSVMIIIIRKPCRDGRIIKKTTHNRDAISMKFKAALHTALAKCFDF